MRANECDVAVIGAGISGLASASRLVAAGKEVICLEATDRVGGRILTIHDPLAVAPIELGAEFVHGLPSETWTLIHQHRLTAYEQTSDAVHIDGGRIVNEKKVGEVADKLLSKLGESHRKNDESFESYLRRSHQPINLKKWAALQVEGFNAARKEVISADSLTADAKAAAKIDGDHAFRILNGYRSIPLAILNTLPADKATIRLNSVVEHVKWRRDAVEVRYRQRFDQHPLSLRCRKLIVTVSLGVLQANPASLGVIRFDPQPEAILRAAASLEFGQVYRVTFRFRNAFWENDTLKRVGFLLSQDKGFFTWWTTHPIISPTLTGWTAGSGADQFRGLDESHIVAAAIASLSRILHRKVPRPEAVYFHDWQADPFFRGAYSYAPAERLSARSRLAKPVENTLFFAGEATESKGHASTVHGAIASGFKAADLILALQ